MSILATATESSTWLSGGTDAGWIEFVSPPHRGERQVQLLREPIELAEDNNEYPLTKSVPLTTLDVL